MPFVYGLYFTFRLPIIISLENGKTNLFSTKLHNIDFIVYASVVWMEGFKKKKCRSIRKRRHSSESEDSSEDDPENIE